MADIQTQQTQQLYQYLTEYFNLSELKELAFDLGVDYEMLPHSDYSTFARNLIGFFVRRGNLSCLVQEALRYRPDDSLKALLSQMSPCNPSKSVQIVLPQESIENSLSLREKLAEVLGVSAEEVTIIATHDG